MLWVSRACVRMRSVLDAASVHGRSGRPSHIALVSDGWPGFWRRILGKPLQAALTSPSVPAPFFFVVPVRRPGGAYQRGSRKGYRLGWSWLALGGERDVVDPPLSLSPPPPSSVRGKTRRSIDAVSGARNARGVGPSEPSVRVAWVSRRSRRDGRQCAVPRWCSRAMKRAVVIRCCEGYGSAPANCILVLLVLLLRPSHYFARQRRCPPLTHCGDRGRPG